MKLTTPEGYFDMSLEKTMASANRIDRRRKMFVFGFGAVAMALCAYFSIQSAKVAHDEKEYLAQQEEMARLDIFFEVNQ